ncbi:gluconeogenesis factor YvcK family protein [Neomoorella thermoacetica]|uniref:Putative gluconeogenesis factor n=3 Tax=Neomoorella thermoacetica TaxID=1525 RepID=A0A1D7X7A4_NEOTH|nr:gluconeogenesis factor YvcK family protein [Moorella thermoacetica]AKX93091.1 gluconeogenesis factor [Moorella thermoacetica]AKX95641.1 gluconeogenesis factor [Moorella thermoacetica]AOQ22762.1 Gluconeogenesis factor [Moorella thermoacetica]APC07440.1 gluconeogenesis factor [Moorella thermoacetica]OIQ08776.1 gluconeogenesis factor [Moorella thermoacetica]
MDGLKWLYPGLKIKRWLLLAVLGLLLLVSGLTVILGITLLASAEKGVTWFILHTLGGLGSPLLAGLLAMALGAVFIGVAVRNLARSVIQVLLPGHTANPWQVFYRRQYLARGPHLVAIGGGTGLAVLLRGLKNYTRNLTAIVTVADDGGSSGRLRQELSIPPPGDIRNCLVALADTESLMEDLFSYRFRQGEGLAGHSLGNLLLAAMTDMAGDFDRAIQELARVLAVGGRVIPSTTTHVVMGAELADGSTVLGESNIPLAGKPIKRVFLKPADCRPPAAALEAIARADAVIIGPGSLYTSVLPNLLVPGIVEALRDTPAPVFYVCNIMTQPGETDGYTVADHLRALIDHCGQGIIDTVIAHSGPISRAARRRYGEKGARPVLINSPAIARMGVELRRGWLVDETHVVRHHPERLASLVMEEVYRHQARGRRRFFYLVRERFRTLAR